MWIAVLVAIILALPTLLIAVVVGFSVVVRSIAVSVGRTLCVATMVLKAFFVTHAVVPVAGVVRVLILIVFLVAMILVLHGRQSVSRAEDTECGDRKGSGPCQAL